MVRLERAQQQQHSSHPAMLSSSSSSSSSNGVSGNAAKNRNRSGTIRPSSARPSSNASSSLDDHMMRRQLSAEEGHAGLDTSSGSGHSPGEQDYDEDDEEGDADSNSTAKAAAASLQRRPSDDGRARKRALLTDVGADWKSLLKDTGDVGRRYAHLCLKTAHEVRESLPPEYSQPPTFIKPTMKAALHPRRRLPLGCLVILLVFFVRFHWRSPTTLEADYYLRQLSSPSFNASNVDRTTGVYRSANKAIVLESFTNPYGFVNLIDPYAGGVFNPSLLVLPDNVGLGFRHLLVARGSEKYEVIEKEDVRWQTLVGCFMLPLLRPHLNLPYLARESTLEMLKLPAERKLGFTRCANPMFDQFVGPEDPRLFFTNIGQPLLIYSQSGNTPGICRAMYIIDARMVVPDLGKVLKIGGWDPPIVFDKQTDLIRDDQFDIEKNWSPFLGENDELFFHVSLVPQLIYKYIPGLTLRPLVAEPPQSNCLTQIVGADMTKVHFHHATPFLRATLCRRGECVPTVHNTVLFGMMHIKYFPIPYLFYERRIVTMNTTSPYEYISVSKPLTYSGTNQADPIFTTSMTWDHPSSRHGLGLNHGFMDDVIMTSFGVRDYGSAYIDILARDMLTDHLVCTGVKRTSLWS